MLKKIKVYLFKKERRPELFLILVILLHLFVNIQYQIKNTIPTTWDDSWHTAISFSYYNTFTGHPTNLENFPLTYERSTKYPHLIHLIPLPLYMIFGVHANVAAFSMTFFLILSIIFTFLIGKEVYDKKVGVYAAILYSFFPIIFGLSRIFVLDFPLISFVAGTIFFLLRYSKTRQDKYIYLSLLFIILGIFTKQTFIIFTLAPILYTLYKIHPQIFEIHNKSKTYKKYLLIFSSIGLLLTLLYIYSFSGLYLLKIFIHNLSLSNFSQGLSESFVSLYKIQTSVLFSILLIVSLFKYKEIKERTMFSLWVCIPILFIAATNIPSYGRYTAVILPALSIILTHILFTFRKKISYSLYILMLLGFFLGFINITFGSGSLRVYVIPITQPQNTDWKIESMLKDIQQLNPNAKIVTGFNFDKFNAHIFAMEAIEKRYNFSIGYFTNNLDAPDFFIVKSGRASVDINFDNVYKYIERNNLRLLFTYELPDNTAAQIYGRNE